jgi:hypothetical protein
MDLDMFEKSETIRVINHIKDNMFLILSNCLVDPEKKTVLYEILGKLEANVRIGKMEREGEMVRRIKSFVSVIDTKISFL